MGVPVVHVANPSESLADIETEDTLYEIETGLKKRADDLEGRISEAKKPVIVIVPNSDVAESETYGRLRSEKAIVVTVDGLTKKSS